MIKKKHLKPPPIDGKNHAMAPKTWFYILYYYYIHYTADQERVAGYTPSHHLDAFSTYETSEAMTTATLLIYSLQEERLINGLQTFPNRYSTKNTFKH